MAGTGSAVGSACLATKAVPDKDFWSGLWVGEAVVSKTGCVGASSFQFSQSRDVQDLDDSQRHCSQSS